MEKSTGKVRRRLTEAEVVKALRVGKPLVVHETIGMTTLNMDGVERVTIRVPKPGADNAEQ
jgi:hypothetical protein